MIYTIKLTNQQVKILENDLLDVNQWIQDTIIGKYSKCKKRLLIEWHPKLLADSSITSLPATEDKLIQIIFTHKEYKNRIDRKPKEKPSVPQSKKIRN